MDGDNFKTRPQLLAELAALRKCLAELRQSHKPTTDRQSAYDDIRPSLPDLNFIYDLDGRYIDVLDNHSQLVVYPEIGDLKGSLVHNVLPREVADLLLDSIRTSADANTVKTVEYELEVPAGMRWFEGRLAPIKTNSSKPECVILVSRDITERKNLQIAQAQRISTLEQALKAMDPKHEALPICSFCHKIRVREKNWQDLAYYLYERYQIQLSHGVCPHCIEKYYPDYAE